MGTMKKIGIIGAMETEVAYLKHVAAGKESSAGGLTFFEGAIGGVGVVVVRSGVGKVNAALCAQRLIMQYGVTHIINTGIAGAAASGLGVFDFVVSTDAVYHDMDATGFGYAPTVIPQMACSAFPADKTMLAAAQEAFVDGKDMFGGHKLIAGRVATGDQFIADKAVKARIVTTCAPACVEMEGAAIAHACWLNETPFVILRCMSDMADDEGEATSVFNEQAAAEMSARLVVNLLKKL